MEITAPYTSRSPAPAVDALAKPASRLLFVDNIRIFLTILVILHHLMVIYSGNGSWIYMESRQDDITNALGGWFCSVNQAYFMGLFLLIAAYFVPGSYDRKGPGKFLVDRLIRLGIPLAVYCWILRPLFIFFGMHQTMNRSFFGWYTGEYFQTYGLIGGGPLWFIEALFLFSILYVLGRQLVRPRPALTSSEARFPGDGVIVLFALLLGFASFLVRIVFPVNDTFTPLNFQFANFAQYTALFTLGLVAYRRNWLNILPDKVGLRWLGAAILLILIYPPLALLLLPTGSKDFFLGGWHWQSLVSALWEAFLCLSACIGLIYLFRRHLDHQGTFRRELSRSAYTAYLIHEPVITALVILAAGVMIYPVFKFALAAMVLIPLCFTISSLIRRLPYAHRVL
jgi:glucan biosynthesis protein C